VELARLAKVPSTQAEVMADSAALIKQFDEAMTQIRASGDAHAMAGDVNLGAIMARVKLDVLRNRLPAQEAGRRITEAATRALGIERCSIWAFNDLQTAIKCVDLYSSKTKNHATGTELWARDFPTYFDAIRTERTILAHDAHRDPRTAEFSTPYLTPLGINALLDVPIWRRGKIYGVLCHEHTGRARQWSPDEEDFAYAAGSLFGLVLD
jgi:GAF domain-containing protein